MADDRDGARTGDRRTLERFLPILRLAEDYNARAVRTSDRIDREVAQILTAAALYQLRRGDGGKGAKSFASAARKYASSIDRNSGGERGLPGRAPGPTEWLSGALIRRSEACLALMEKANASATPTETELVAGYLAFSMATFGVAVVPGAKRSDLEGAKSYLLSKLGNGPPSDANELARWMLHGLGKSSAWINRQFAARRKATTRRVIARKKSKTRNT